MKHPPPTRWVEVDTGALAHNLSQARSLLHRGCRVMAVVKANGYGHGLTLAGRAFSDAGADALGVTTLEEALALRAEGLPLPILVFAPCLPSEAGWYVEHGLTATLTTPEAAEALAREGQRQGRDAEAHLKVDTGMGRVGVLPDEAVGLAKQAAGLSGLRLTGIYTHLALAQDAERASRQLARFDAARKSLAAEAIEPPLAHAANSAAAIARPEARLDMVRVGTLLYGQYPPGVPQELDLRPTWRLRARLMEVRQIPRGWRVSYGGEFTAPRPLRVGVLAIGYADGFGVSQNSLWRGARGLRRWLASRRGPALSVTVGGSPAPVLGRVAAQLCVVDLSRCPGARPGDVAEVPARRTLVGSHVPRIPAL